MASCKIRAGLSGVALTYADGASDHFRWLDLRRQGVFFKLPADLRQEHSRVPRLFSLPSAFGRMATRLTVRQIKARLADPAGQHYVRCGRDWNAFFMLLAIPLPYLFLASYLSDSAPVRRPWDAEIVAHLPTEFRVILWAMLILLALMFIVIPPTFFCFFRRHAAAVVSRRRVVALTAEREGVEVRRADATTSFHQWSTLKKVHHLGMLDFGGARPVRIVFGASADSEAQAVIALARSYLPCSKQIRSQTTFHRELLLSSIVVVPPFSAAGWLNCLVAPVGQLNPAARILIITALIVMVTTLLALARYAQCGPRHTRLGRWLRRGSS